LQYRPQFFQQPPGASKRALGVGEPLLGSADTDVTSFALFEDLDLTGVEFDLSMVPQALRP
jgi:hypothetical protein